jgi:organic radical activating enzyme
MMYRVKEVFATLQGEGFHAGCAAVFVRFAGCNQWSGRDHDRRRDAARHGNRCALFCDTEFVGGDVLTAAQIRDLAARHGAGQSVPIVLTGGEPLLQVDAGLASALRETGALLHVETNGTVTPRAALDWTTCSPKTAPSVLALRVCDELKVVVPAYDPNEYIGAIEARFLYVQAEDGPAFRENTAKAVAFVQAHPEWRLSVQTHKFINIP